jgi:hypothetical protein
MQFSKFLNLSSKTKFRLTLQLYTVGFGVLAAQLLLLRVPPLDLVTTLAAVLYLVQVSKELKTRKELFSRKQKHVLFGYECTVYALVLVALADRRSRQKGPHRMDHVRFGLGIFFRHSVY